jgi:hypothetical protein
MEGQKITFTGIIDLTKDDLAISIEHHDERPSSDFDFYGGRKRQRTTARTHLKTSTLPLNTSLPDSESISSVPASQPINFSNQEIEFNNDNAFRNLSPITLVKPINNTSALHRSSYGPETIARDVLVTAGLHPHRKGLNSHLEVLRTRFTKVDDSSDLATFRWDLVDPDGPQPPSLKYLPALGVGSSHSAEKLPVCGPLDPIRGGIFSSVQNLPQLPTDTTPHQPSSLRNTSTLGPDSSFQAVSAPPQPLGRPPVNFRISDNREISQAPASDMSLPGASLTLRRGQSPKGLTGTRLESPGMTLKKRGRPFKFPRTSPPTEHILKKRGRPAKNPDAAGVSASPDRFPKKRGRPFKAPRPEPRLPEPKFIPFLCEWQDCPAELHNLETLRVHIFKVHRKKLPSGVLPCLWRKCGTIHGVIDTSQHPNVSEKSFEFDATEHWQNHINKAHLVPLSWHMGDGPRGTSLGMSLCS